MGEKPIYNTQQIWIKPGHRMFHYFQEMCENSKNLYNTTNFFIRQVYTGLTTTKSLQPLQEEVLDAIHKNIGAINAKQIAAYEKRLANELKKPKEKQKTINCNLFENPGKDKPYVSYNFLDALFKQIEQPDYKSLPVQNSQGVMRNVFDNWKSFFASLKDYNKNPSKYLGRPKIPNYIKNTVRLATFSNQDCVIKDNKFLKFPKTKEKLNIGKLGYTKEKLKSVRVIPRHSQFVVEIIFEENTVELISETPNRVMTIDLGIDNLATITTNTGKAPVLLKGKNIKSVNQYYNKMRAYYYGILRQGKKTNEGSYASKRLIDLDALRHRKLKDLFHKASFFVMSITDLEEIDTIIIGQNKGWKQNINMSKKNNQNFIGIPFNLFINMVKYKAETIGINVIVTEESYTSKASFLDEDDIPVYGEEKTPKFSGRRVSRGIYRTKENKIINADVNGSANIMRKCLHKKGILLHNEDVKVDNPLSYKIA